jgi:hypothetical protein
MVNDYGKLYLLALAMILGAIFSGILAIVGQVTAAVGIFGMTVGTAVGYLTGNGVLAAKGEAPSPVYVPTPEQIGVNSDDA